MKHNPSKGREPMIEWQPEPITEIVRVRCAECKQQVTAMGRVNPFATRCPSGHWVRLP